MPSGLYVVRSRAEESVGAAYRMCGDGRGSAWQVSGDGGCGLAQWRETREEKDTCVRSP